MSNRAFLSNPSGELFEAINTIPVFWLHLLDKNLIEKTENKIKKYFNRNNDDDEERIIIKTSKKIFIKNLNSGRNFIEENHNGRIELYDNFIHYLDKKFNENDILELDITEIAWFFDDAGSFIGTLRNYGFEANESIYSYVGYSYTDGDDDFRNYSKAYSEYCQNEEKENKIKLEKENSRRNVYEIKENVKIYFYASEELLLLAGEFMV